MKFIAVIFSIVFLCSCANTSKIEPIKMAEEVSNYLTFKNKKAYAVAIDSKDTWASGWGFGYSRQQQANERAMRECEKSRATHKVTTDCNIHYEGSTKKGGI